MRSLYCLLVGLCFTVAFTGCENQQKRSVDKAASEKEKAIKEDAKATDQAIDENDREMKDEVKADKNAALQGVKDEAKAEKDELEEEDSAAPIR
jgi:hypothetical protein